MATREGGTPPEGRPGGAMNQEPARGGGWYSAWWVWVVGIIIVGIIVAWIIWAAVADDNELLVVPGQNAQVQEELDEGAAVQVTGTVQEFEFDTFDTEIGDEDDFGDFEGRQVLIADQIQTLGEEADQEQGAVQIEEIVEEDNGEFEGQQVTVVGEVQDEVGIESFTITPIED